MSCRAIGVVGSSGAGGGLREGVEGAETGGVTAGDSAEGG